MSEAELEVVLLALLPIVPLEEQTSKAMPKCKFMIGTLPQMILIRANNLMLRVGGGFSTLEAYIRQVGAFECIKIFKAMGGNADKQEPPMSFKEVVVGNMTRLKAP